MTRRHYLSSVRKSEFILDKEDIRTHEKASSQNSPREGRILCFPEQPHVKQRRVHTCGVCDCQYKGAFVKISFRCEQH